MLIDVHYRWSWRRWEFPWTIHTRLLPWWSVLLHNGCQINGQYWTLSQCKCIYTVHCLLVKSNLAILIKTCKSHLNDFISDAPYIFVLYFIFNCTFTIYTRVLTINALLINLSLLNKSADTVTWELDRSLSLLRLLQYKVAHCCNVFYNIR